MSVTWSIKPFTELDIHELHDLLRLRSDVFVVEQQCVYPDLDGLDISALHVLGHEADGALVAYARVLPPANADAPHIGRVVVHPDHRGQGLARELMLRTMAASKAAHGTAGSVVEAQSHLEKFYQSLGYVRQAPDHDLDGIPHVLMQFPG